ncbi:hypothetical protein P4493_05650 [Bacillus thuringiensis]|jgi:hypothetical protein|uniref:Uncharacterized protein n=3 Tax=Bacillus thuringiensis TaxID=1428 RepID=A0A0B5NLJ8_BACTU|nr:MULTISPECIES: hypothetical protein [Bacillus]MEC2534105.1 hypothetical protein [Bacillus cereus]MED1153974.1 hypothetical protein [Bacillus paranthracis]OUB09188.1 hypothetical protein BK708_32135 [Bacillus thuringiensis serovar yunnanensis]AFQ29846.1 hypothetical protein BTF1_28727 [Bacillus thuringiensis HD-789]AJG74212.1 hypothetical protein BF38_6090 [Bacillus thuringiensis]
MRRSRTFSTVKEFRKEYDNMRIDILKRHNITDPSKARLKNAMRLYQTFNNQWTPITMKKSDMENRIKMYEDIPDRQACFMLEALV